MAEEPRGEWIDRWWGLFLGEENFWLSTGFDLGGTGWSKEAGTLWLSWGNAKCKVWFLEDLAGC